MGKRKKSSRKPAPARQKVPLGEQFPFRNLACVLIHLFSLSDTTFTCLFCHHEKSVTVRMDRKEGVANLVCRVCDQRYQSKVNRKRLPSFAIRGSPRQLGFSIDLTEPIDIYSEWIDAADAAQREDAPRRPVASSSRAARAPAYDSDDE
jgi:transcription elongation factor Elf1